MMRMIAPLRASFTAAWMWWKPALLAAAAGGLRLSFGCPANALRMRLAESFLQTVRTWSALVAVLRHRADAAVGEVGLALGVGERRRGGEREHRDGDQGRSHALQRVAARNLRSEARHGVERGVHVCLVDPDPGAQPQYLAARTASPTRSMRCSRSSRSTTASGAIPSTSKQTIPAESAGSQRRARRTPAAPARPSFSRARARGCAPRRAPCRSRGGSRTPRPAPSGARTSGSRPASRAPRAGRRASEARDRRRAAGHASGAPDDPGAARPEQPLVAVPATRKSQPRSRGRSRPRRPGRGRRRRDEQRRVARGIASARGDRGSAASRRCSECTQVTATTRVLRVSARVSERDDLVPEAVAGSS